MSVPALSRGKCFHPSSAAAQLKLAFIDSAELFFQRGQTALAVRVLSNLAEMELENRHILRILAYRLSQQHDLSATFTEMVRGWPSETEILVVGGT